MNKNQKTLSPQKLSPHPGEGEVAKAAVSDQQNTITRMHECRVQDRRESDRLIGQLYRSLQQTINQVDAQHAEHQQTHNTLEFERQRHRIDMQEFEQCRKDLADARNVISQMTEAAARLKLRWKHRERAWRGFFPAKVSKKTLHQ